MQLEFVEIRDYRSIFVDDGGQSFRLDLASGANTLVGQNNCGKSNVLRAISLALDPSHEFDADADVPGPRPFSYPIITLGFCGDHSNPADAVVLDAAEKYERSFVGTAGPTRAEDGHVVLRVSYVPTDSGVERQEELLTVPGAHGTLSASLTTLLVEAINELRSAVRFVLISSGESIESVLEGNFREILHSVVRDRLHLEFEQAETSRRQYVDGLQESLLRPLRDRLADDVKGLFPEIGGVGLSPAVSSIERTLSEVAISIDDIVSTPLAGKGTGVRGGVLVAMLSYLALNATRGMVFALEEPEAFLHPGAQEDLRDHLEGLAAASGVTLLLTTHSPFIVTRSSEGRVFCLAKDTHGRTRISEQATGDADHAPLIGDLLRETTIESLLAASSAIPPGTEAIVLVEGEGDRFCLELAAQVVGRPDLLDGLAIKPTGGTTQMIAQAVITRAATELPILVVVDNDDPGRKARSDLVGARFGYHRQQIINYAELFGPKWQAEPVEAEDVFASALISDFIEEHGESVIAGSRRRPDDAFHYDFDRSAKELLNGWLRKKTRPEHVEKWIELLLMLRQRAKLSVPNETASDIVTAGSGHVGESTGDGHRPPSGDALIVTGQHDYARYQASGAIILDAEQQLSGSVTHIGFYNRVIQPVVAAILDDHPNRLFSAATCDQLRETGKTADATVADLIESAIRTDSSLVGSSHRVLVLSRPDSDESLRLDTPIKNTKKSRGRPVAWTIGPRVVPVAALQAQPTTTNELDELVAELQPTDDTINANEGPSA
jgi:putative ATP-dependent endonuclease of the OLD family